MHFTGEVITKWLQHSGDDRYMELMEDFKYQDDNGFEWIAPLGHKINGASIPEAVWSVMGSPFVGDYRRASVLHDYECDVKKNPHKKVHRMFYDAMICDGVSIFKAKYMYQAVRLFGPKWGRDISMKSNTFGVREIDLGLLNNNLELDINELEKKLDQILGE